MEPIIKYTYDTIRSEMEAEEKEWRGGIIVIIGSKQYELSAISIYRLQQEFHREIQEQGFFWPENNTIIVENVTKKEIEFTIKKLYEHGFWGSPDS